MSRVNGNQEWKTRLKIRIFDLQSGHKIIENWSMGKSRKTSTHIFTFFRIQHPYFWFFSILGTFWIEVKKQRSAKIRIVWRKKNSFMEKDKLRGSLYLNEIIMLIITLIYFFYILLIQRCPLIIINRDSHFDCSPLACFIYPY